MKKNIPLQVLIELEPFLKNKSNFIKFRKKKDCILSFVDKDIDSDFYFEVTKYEYKASKITYIASKKPMSPFNNENTTLSAPIENLKLQFDSWLKIIEDYDKVPDYFDEDPILKGYQNEFFENLKLLDNDADIKPYNFKQQLAIEKHINSIIATIENEKQSDETVEILKDSSNLKDNIGKLTKAETFHKICQIWAKIRKYSFQTLKNIMTSSSTKLIEYSVSKGVEILLNSIKDNL